MKFEIIKDIKKLNDLWNYFYKFNTNDEFKYTYLNKKRTIVLLNGIFYYIKWMSSNFDSHMHLILPIYNVEKLINDKYSYLSFVSDSFNNFDHFYAIKRSHIDHEFLDRNVSEKFKIPTDKIPSRMIRNCETIE